MLKKTSKKTSKGFSLFIKSIFRRSSFRTKLLFTTGILILVIPSFFYVNEYVQLAYFTPKVVAVRPSHLSPIVEITIPAVDMDLQVFETAITHGVWGIADSGISHLNISANPGENGAIILYGHNTNDRFGPIRWLSSGAKVIVTTKDGKKHEYIVHLTKDVSSQDVSVLSSFKGQTLILYTCDGFADLQRFIAVAKPS